MVIGKIYCRKGEEHLAVMAVKPIESVQYLVYRGVIKFKFKYTPEKYNEVMQALNHGWFPYEITRR